VEKDPDGTIGASLSIWRMVNYFLSLKTLNFLIDLFYGIWLQVYIIDSSVKSLNDTLSAYDGVNKDLHSGEKKRNVK